MTEFTLPDLTALLLDPATSNEVKTIAINMVYVMGQRAQHEKAFAEMLARHAAGEIPALLRLQAG